MTGILVGVDGSDASRQALRWAMREAGLRRAPLTVLTVRPDQARPATMVFWGLGSYPESSLNQEHARRKAREFADQVATEAGGTAPEIAVSALTGNAAAELVRASRDADLIVVGSRGGGGFARLLMGSVSSQVVHHAACPVVVVPGTRPSC